MLIFYQPHSRPILILWGLIIISFGWARLKFFLGDCMYKPVLQLSPGGCSLETFSSETRSPPISFRHRTLSPPIHFHQKIFRHQSPFARGLFATDPNSPPIKIISSTLPPTYFLTVSLILFKLLYYLIT